MVAYRSAVSPLAAFPLPLFSSVHYKWTCPVSCPDTRVSAHRCSAGAANERVPANYEHYLLPLWQRLLFRSLYVAFCTLIASIIVSGARAAPAAAWVPACLAHSLQWLVPASMRGLGLHLSTAMLCFPRRPT